MSTNSPPNAPSNTPSLTPQERLAALRTKVETSRDFTEDTKKELKTEIETLEQQQQSLDEQRLKDLEKRIENIEAATRVDLPVTEEEQVSELGDTLGSAGLLTGEQGQQMDQAMKKMGKFKKVLYSIAKSLIGVPILGPMIKDWIDKNAPESVKQEMEREKIGDQLIETMKNTLGKGKVVRKQKDMDHYMQQLQEVYNQAPPPKSDSFEKFCKEKISRLSTIPPQGEKYELVDLLRLAKQETSPIAIQQQREQAKESTDSLEGRKKKAYALALVNAFNDAAGGKIVVPEQQGTKNSIDYAGDIGILLADALANEAFEDTLELELDPHLQATDTCNSWYTSGIADYDFLPSNKQPDTSALYTDLINNPEAAFKTLLLINSTPLDTTSRTAINKIQSSLRTAERTMSLDLRQAPEKSNTPAASTNRPAPIQTTSTTPAAKPAADPPSTATV